MGSPQYFSFGPFWGIFKGLWLEGLTWMFIIYITYFLAPELFFFFLGSATFWGFFGKDLYIQKLISLNYEPTDIITSNSPSNLNFSIKNK